MKNISEIVDDYNRKNKLVDKSFVDSICINYVNTHNLNKYLRDVYVTNRSLKYGHGVYNSFDKTLTIQLKDELPIELQSKLGDEATPYYNLFVLRLLFHELEHVRQEKLMYEDDSSLESLLIKLNNYLFLKSEFNDNNIIDRIKDRIELISYFKYYRKYQYYAPIERMADIKAYQDLKETMDDSQIEIASKVHTEFNRDNDLDLNATIKSGYRLIGNKTNSPSLDYLKNIRFLKDILDERRIIEKSKDLDLKERLYLGLSISKDEFDKIDIDNPYVKRKHNRL